MFVKVFSDLLDSSLWAEDSDTRIVWLTLLMLADEDGLVRATLPGIAHRAHVSEPATGKALVTFEKPDPNSRTPDHEGRRIERTDGGYLILNYMVYRATTTKEQQREQTRKRVEAYRKRKHGKDITHRNASVTPSNALLRHTEADVEAEAEAEYDIPQDDATIPQETDANLPRREGKGREGKEGKGSPPVSSSAEMTLKMIQSQYVKHNPGSDDVAAPWIRTRLLQLIDAYGQEKVAAAIAGGTTGERVQALADRLNGVKPPGQRLTFEEEALERNAKRALELVAERKREEAERDRKRSR